MQTIILDYQNKQLLCIGLTATHEKVTLTRQKNMIKILAKLYESATSHSIDIFLGLMILQYMGKTTQQLKCVSCILTALNICK